MPIKTGDTVSVHYVGTFNDGTEFDRSREGSPLKFKVGSGMVIPAAEAYGEKQEHLLFPVPMDQVPATIKPEVGMHLHVGTNQGELEVVISEVTDTHIVLDANHPMAGKDLNFALEVVAVN